MRTSFWRLAMVVAGVIALAGGLMLGGVTPALAAQAPATGGGTATGSAAEAPATPRSPQVNAQEGADDVQYVERDTSSDSAWIVIAVVLLIVFTVLGVALAALGLSAE